MGEKLPLVVDKLDAIPEPLRGAYVETDGKFRLNTDVEDVSGLKAKNSELLGKLKAANDRAKLLGERTAEEIQADFDLAAKTREEKHKAEGNFEAAKAEMLKGHQAQLAKVAEDKAKVEAQLHKVLVVKDADRAIRDAGLEPEVLEPHVTPHLKVVYEEGEAVARVVDAKGNVRFNEKGEPMTVDQLVSTIVANPKFAGLVPASGVKGGGAGNEGANVRGGAVVLIPKDASVAEYRRMKDDAVKRGVPYRIAE